MQPRIEIVDPIQHVEAAGAILRAAWTPPCLYYSTEYLRWQFSFPGELPKLGTIAFLDERPVGCIAVTNRCLARDGVRFPAYALSFVAVEPAAARRGVGSAMYAHLLAELARDIPILAFTEPDTAGERLLLNSCQRAGFRHVPLRACCTMGYLGRSAGDTSHVVVRPTEVYSEFASACRPLYESKIIRNDITVDYFRHYRSDPRKRLMVTVEGSGGSPIGTAMIVMAEIFSADRVGQVPMIESIDLHQPTSECLAALFRFAASEFGLKPVLASNLTCISDDVIRAAGIRAIPSSFNSYVLVKGRHEMIEGAAASNLEVI